MLGGKRFKNRFLKRWGTETIDGVEVLKERFTIYPGYKTDKDIQSMCKMLGMWNQIQEANFSPIAGYYLWLNPNKGSTNELSQELLAEKIDEFCPYMEWQESTINYVEKSDPNKFKGWTKEQIYEFIDNDYRNIFSKTNGFVVEDQLAERLMGKYVLFDDDTEFDVEVLSTSIASIHHSPAYSYDSNFRYTKTKQIYYTGLTMTIRYRRKVNGIDPDKLLIQSMIEEKEEARLADLQILQLSQRTYDDDNQWFDATKIPVTNTIWYKDQLRLSAVRAVGIRTSVAVDAILSTLDTGQIKKKVKWYKKVLGFVLLVIAIVLAAPTGGASWSLATVALYVGIAMMVMIAIQAKWAKNNAAAAGYMGRWVKIANIISIATGIAAVYQSIAKEALKQALVQEAVKQGATQAVAQQVVKTMTQEAIKMTVKELSLEVGKEAVLGAVKEIVMNNLKSIAFKVLNKVVEMRQSDMQADLQNKSAQVEASNELLNDMMDKNLNICVEDIKWYTDQSGTAQSRYDVDHQYEGEPATIHIGNICRASFYNGNSLNLRAEDLA